jgi:hypothetical protein
LYQTDSRQGIGGDRHSQRIQVRVLSSRVSPTPSLLHVSYAFSLYHVAVRHSLASYEATEWAKRQRASQVGSNSSNSAGSAGAGDSQPSNYDLFRLAARNLDSGYSYSLDIQEKYGLI